MDIKDDFKLLLEMRGYVEHVFFKNFEKQYDFPKGLNLTHVLTMVMLKFHPYSPMSEISQHLNLERGSFTTIADKLIRLGYIISERGTKDRRIYHLSLTDDGMVIVKDFMSNHKAYADALFDHLDQKQQADFFKAVAKISGYMEIIGGDLDMDMNKEC